MLDELWYHIEFRYPSNAQAIFHGIISAGEAEIKEHISAILQTHLNVVREQQAITEAASARERERQLAYFDLATWLPNRAKLEDDLMNLRADDGTIVVFSVMDDEKMHDRKKRAGIERWITHGLQANQEKIGDWYRLGENLFAIVVPGNKSKEEVNTQVNSLSEIFSQWTDNHVNLSFYKGATRTTPKYALEEAEDAHAAARSTQSPKILYFEKEHLDRKRRQEGISRLVQEALDNPEDSDCEILPFYQLKVDLNNPEKIECEALLRCQDRRTGYLYNTADVVECIEGDFGTSTRTTIMMIRKIAQHMEKEKRLHVSINMDTYSWLSEEVLHVLVDELPRFLSPKRISLEVLEREKLTDEMRETIWKLQKLGYQIEIDDFGQGNSNYDRAVELNANRLKIDGKFVGMLENSETRSKGEAIIRGIISLAKDLSMWVLAEWVETKETCKLLQGLEITSFQWWFFTKAVPFEKLGDAIDQVQRRLQEIWWGIQEKLI